MKHSFFDKYSYINSPIHRIHPVIKIIVFFVFSVSVILISESSFLIHIIGFFILLTLIYFSKVPFVFIIKRVFIIFPFIFMIALCNFFSRFTNYNVIIKSILNSFLIIIALILLVETTRFSELLYGLSKLGFPKIIIILLSFIYRYFFVFIDEVEKMLCSAKIRSYGKIPLKTLANMVGIFFIRSYESSERIYFAMRMRGFNGEIKL